MAIEVELKALAPNFDVSVLDANYSLIGSQQQLNHYYSNADVTYDDYDTLIYIFSILIKDKKLFYKFRTAIQMPQASIRTRELKSNETKTVFLVIKYSLSGESAVNGSKREEIEIPLDVELYILDGLLLAHNLTNTSRWSRHRVVYAPNSNDANHTICVDTNAGYGPLIEIESVVETELEASLIIAELQAVLKTLNLVEVNPHLLDDMFVFYEQHWQDYYLTHKLIWHDPRFLNRLEGLNLAELGFNPNG